MDHFAQCHKINNLLVTGEELEARNELIQLLASLSEDGLEYSPLVNHLIREVGLFPYMEPTTASWQERYIYEVFKTDVGDKEPLPLHREQSRLLNALLAGKSIAVSAPTSFGKSFVIDSFISIKHPSNVVILVPTIALADETRRRLQRKFGGSYKIITTSDQTVGPKNIFVFPQERVIGYLDALTQVDILIVDEFYKASKSFDKERSPSLIRAIIRLSPISSQRYFLAPNINELIGNPFTEGMEFLRMDFNTIFLEKNELFRDIGKNQEMKSTVLVNLLGTNKGKTLIYAGTYANIEKVSNLLMTNIPDLDRGLLTKFQSWLAKNYDPNWALTKLVAKGVGIHNGRLHRSLSQIQIRLFEEEEGLDRMISTSSIIEGVNTSAENVILWSNRKGQAKIDDFTYKNIIGRGGRMFRHFIGRIFVLEEPPPEEPTTLELQMPEELLGVTKAGAFEIEYSSDQVAAIENYKRTMSDLLGPNTEDFIENDLFHNSNARLIMAIAKDIKANLSSWNGLNNLNSDNTNRWDRYLYKLINLSPQAWGIEFNKYVSFIKILAENWNLSIPELLEKLDEHEIGIDQFFELERNTTFKLSSLLGDVQTIYNRINPANAVDLTLAISRLSHGFLPPTVHQLEEYGMPRMLSRKIHTSGVLDLQNPVIEVHETLERFRTIGQESLVRSVGVFDEFDRYILHYFYEGIEVRGESATIT